jgi:hypothetical protein
VRFHEARPSSPDDAFTEAFLRTGTLGIYDVTAIRPTIDNQPQYRLKSIGGRLERAVREFKIVFMPRQRARTENLICFWLNFPELGA